MENDELLRITKEYLLKYVKPCKDGSLVDSDIGDFLDIVKGIEQTSIYEIREKLCSIDDIELLDLGSLYGENMGLWVARANKTAKVSVVNPEYCFDGFAPFLFNDHNKNRVFKLKNQTEFIDRNPELSINNLYKANGLENIKFLKEFITYSVLMHKLSDKNDKRSVVFSERTPTIPLDMPYVISNYVNDSANGDMILMPHINTEIYAYKNDGIIGLINDNIGIGRKPAAEYNVLENFDARVFTAMQQYYALKSAEIAGAKIYLNSEGLKGTPFHHPTHIVSTIKL